MARSRRLKQPETQWRNRITDYRVVPAVELVWNPKNWRLHPDIQRQLLCNVLNEIGVADALVVYRSARADGKLIIIDGHLRADITTNTANGWPCLITDLTDEEADTLLAVKDPLTTMASQDDRLYAELLASVEVYDLQLQTYLENELKRFPDFHNPNDLPFEGYETALPSEPDFVDDEDLMPPTLGGHIRMVQLMLTIETHPEFMQYVNFLRQHFEVDNITDAVVAGIRYAHDTLNRES